MSDTTRSSCACGCNTVSELLAAATASLDTDRGVARACIQRAAELLQSSRLQDHKPAKGSSPGRSSLAPWQRQRLAAYVEANLGSCIRATDLARVAKLSAGHFFRVFRDSFGEPPLVYVTRRRMRRCQELMLSCAAPLSQIALECGMSDQSHLTRVFRRIVGVNPGVWRRQFAKPTGSADGSSPPGNLSDAQNLLVPRIGEGCRTR
jgi:AraC family transcriptional regulator